MSVQTYPLLMSIYKGEGRVLIMPVISHIAGYSVNADWVVNIQEVDDYVSIGNAVICAETFIRNSELSISTPKEREMNPIWKKNSKYKSKLSFWKNNLLTRIKIFEEGHYRVCHAKV